METEIIKAIGNVKRYITVSRRMRMKDLYQDVIWHFLDESGELMKQMP